MTADEKLRAEAKKAVDATFAWPLSYTAAINLCIDVAKAYAAEEVASSRREIDRLRVKLGEQSQWVKDVSSAERDAEIARLTAERDELSAYRHFATSWTQRLEVLLAARGLTQEIIGDIGPCTPADAPPRFVRHEDFWRVATERDDLRRQLAALAEHDNDLVALHRVREVMREVADELRDRSKYGYWADDLCARLEAAAGDVKAEQPARCGAFGTTTGAQCTKETDHDGEHVLPQNVTVVCGGCGATCVTVDGPGGVCHTCARPLKIGIAPKPAEPWPKYYDCEHCRDDEFACDCGKQFQALQPDHDETDSAVCGAKEIGGYVCTLATNHGGKHEAQTLGGSVIFGDQHRTEFRGDRMPIAALQPVDDPSPDPAEPEPSIKSPKVLGAEAYAARHGGSVLDALSKVDLDGNEKGAAPEPERCNASWAWGGRVCTLIAGHEGVHRIPGDSVWQDGETDCKPHEPEAPSKICGAKWGDMSCRLAADHAGGHEAHRHSMVRWRRGLFPDEIAGAKG